MRSAGGLETQRRGRDRRLDEGIVDVPLRRVDVHGLGRGRRGVNLLTGNWRNLPKIAKIRQNIAIFLATIGPYSAVSAPIVTSKCSFCSIFLDLYSHHILAEFSNLGNTLQHLTGILPKSL